MVKPEIQTPAPRNGGVRLTLPGIVGGLWALIVAGAIVSTTYVYATKVELSEHAKEEAATSAELKTKAAVTDQVVNQHSKTFDRIERWMEVQSRNTETLMREVAIPERKIRKVTAEEEE